VNALLQQVKAAGEDFEWYPTTDEMIAAVARRIPTSANSIMDIGAGDGRVLVALAKKCDHAPELFAIEKSALLMQAQPESITPVGADFWEQNLRALLVDYVFCNPPYSDFEAWTVKIIETAFAFKAFLVIPRRWKNSDAIQRALKARGATTKVIYEGDFENAERAARAVIDIVEVSFRHDKWDRKPEDPFDLFFDQQFTSFEPERTIEESEAGVDLAKVRGLKSIVELVEAYTEDYDRMQANYHAIFKLDAAILKELGVSKEKVRDGLKARMAGLKTTYWELLFEKLDALTNRLSTATKKHFLERLTGRTAIEFTVSNCYAIVIWAIRHANGYFDEQLVAHYKALATFEGVSNYKSNQRTWEKNGWRYNGEKDPNSHYALDYRIVVRRYSAIYKPESSFHRDHYDYPGGLNKSCHELIEDIIAVFGNLGFVLPSYETRSRSRQWRANVWQDFSDVDGRVLFQAKAYINGNIHFRFLPEAIRALNVEAGRLLGWLQNTGDVVRELGYSEEEAAAAFGSNHQLTGSSVRQLTAGVPEGV
jgi:predicted RNA methylase